MLDLNTIFSTEERNRIDSYIEHFASGAKGIKQEIKAPFNNRFAIWAKEKEALYHMFGDRLSFSAPLDEEVENMMLENKAYDDETIVTFTYKLKNSFKRQARQDVIKEFGNDAYIYNPNEDYVWLVDGNIASSRIKNEELRERLIKFSETFWFKILQNVCCPQGIVCYNICPEDVKIKIKIEGKQYTFMKGGHLVKFLTKLAKACGDFTDEEIESFRLAHSQLYNAAKAKGEMTVSIHPLDFMTMSNNAADWSSCMTWSGKDSCYCHGTLEMMNSPCVAVAYVGSTSTPFTWDDGNQSWNSKKWRCLFIIDPTKHFVVSVREYPYDSEMLRTAAMNTILDNLVGVEFKRENIRETDHNGTEIFTDPFQYSFNTKRMYNDIVENDGDLPCIVVTDGFIYESHYRYGYENSCCPCCGKPIQEWENKNDSSSLVCHECNQTARCCDCGLRHSITDMTSYAAEEFAGGWRRSENGLFYICSKCEESVRLDPVIRKYFVSYCDPWDNSYLTYQNKIIEISMEGAWALSAYHVPKENILIEKDIMKKIFVVTDDCDIKSTYLENLKEYIKEHYGE